MKEGVYKQRKKLNLAKNWIWQGQHQLKYLIPVYHLFVIKIPILTQVEMILATICPNSGYLKIILDQNKLEILIRYLSNIFALVDHLR